jgi:Family of unknown function (DUF6499)
LAEGFEEGEGASKLETLSLAALAWEMLRRSPGYQAAYARYRDNHIEAQEVPPGAASPWDVGPDWGLVFPG